MYDMYDSLSHAATFLKQLWKVGGAFKQTVRRV